MNDQPALQPNKEFAQPVSDEVLARTAEALTANGMSAEIVNDGATAKARVLALLPEGAEVHAATSRTLEALGLLSEIDESGRYDAVRPKAFKMDRATQADDIRALTSRPNFIVGSVHAITEKGDVVAASFSGSQLAPYISGAGRVIWIVGHQKIVPDLETAFRRVREYSYPLEDARLRAAYGMPSSLNKQLSSAGSSCRVGST